jgi:hypothetical protein
VCVCVCVCVCATVPANARACARVWRAAHAGEEFIIGALTLGGMWAKKNPKLLGRGFLLDDGVRVLAPDGLR